MFQRYLENAQAQALMLPNTYVACPMSNWYMTAGIHLLLGDDSQGEEAERSEATPGAQESEENDGFVAGVFAGIESFNLDDGCPAAHEVEHWSSKSGLIAQLVSTETSDMPADKVKGWMNDNHDAEKNPEWLSSDDDAFSSDTERQTEHRNSLRQCQMSPSNLRPMTANCETTAPDKIEQEKSDELDIAAQCLVEQELQARKIELMCKISGEKTEDVQVMYIHKLQMCTNLVPHDWVKCPYAHEGEVARRRDPAAHSANPCSEYEKSQTCMRGSKCRFSHGVWERGMHPQRYRTSLCSMGEKCDRRVCFFAHKPSEVRKPTNGRGENNQAIASIKLAAETKLSRRKARALQRKLAAGSESTSTLDQFSSLAPPERGVAAGGKSSFTGGLDKITVEVDSRLTHMSRMVEGIGVNDCISPGSSSGTGDLSTTSGASLSQASTVQSVAWAEENLGERVLCGEEMHRFSGELKSELVTRKVSRQKVHALACNTAASAAQEVRTANDGNTSCRKTPITVEAQVHVNHLDSHCLAEANLAVREQAKLPSNHDHSLGWALWATAGMWSGCDVNQATLPAPDSGPVSLGLLPRNTGAHKVHTKKKPLSVLQAPSLASQNPTAEESYESQLISRVLAVGPLQGEGSKSEWLKEPDRLEDAGASAATGGVTARSSSISVFGESIGPKSEWLRGEDLKHVTVKQRDGEVAGICLSRSASPCKIRRSVSQGHELQRGASPSVDRFPVDIEWVEAIVNGGDREDGDGGSEDSIQAWGSWMLSTATSTLAHASPGMRYNGDRSSLQQRVASSRSGDKCSSAHGKSCLQNKSTSWLLTDTKSRKSSSWLLADTSDSSSGSHANIAATAKSATSTSGWLLQSSEDAPPRTQQASSGVGGGGSGVSISASSAFSLASGSHSGSQKSLSSGAQDFVRQSLFGSPSERANTSWLLAAEDVRKDAPQARRSERLYLGSSKAGKGKAVASYEGDSEALQDDKQLNDKHLRFVHKHPVTEMSSVSATTTQQS